MLELPSASGGAGDSETPGKPAEQHGIQMAGAPLHLGPRPGKEPRRALKE